MAIAYKCDACQEFKEPQSVETLRVKKECWYMGDSWWGTFHICKECLMGLKQIWKWDQARKNESNN